MSTVEPPIATVAIRDQARTRIREMPVDEAYETLKRGNNLILVDMREPEELSLGYIKGSIASAGCPFSSR